VRSSDAIDCDATIKGQRCLFTSPKMLVTLNLHTLVIHATYLSSEMANRRAYYSNYTIYTTIDS